MYNVTFPSNRERADVVLDRFDLVYHGFTITHIDALCHVAWDGELFNGRSFKDSLTAAGATWCAIDAYFDGSPRAACSWTSPLASERPTGPSASR